MKLRELPSQERLCELFDYNPLSGRVTWRVRAASEFADDRAARIWNTRYAGTRAGGDDLKGHRVIRICGQSYFEHRLILQMVNGACTATDVDHIDGDGHNNRLANLREVSHAENARNMRRHSDNRSGVSGVRFEFGAWTAEIGARQHRRKLGRFKDMASAIAARKAAEIAHGYHPNHGRAA